MTVTDPTPAFVDTWDRNYELVEIIMSDDEMRKMWISMDDDVPTSVFHMNVTESYPNSFSALMGRCQ